MNPRPAPRDIRTLPASPRAVASIHEGESSLVFVFSAIFAASPVWTNPFHRNERRERREKIGNLESVIGHRSSEIRDLQSRFYGLSSVPWCLRGKIQILLAKINAN